MIFPSVMGGQWKKLILVIMISMISVPAFSELSADLEDVICLRKIRDLEAFFYVKPASDIVYLFSFTGLYCDEPWKTQSTDIHSEYGIESSL